MRIIMTIVPSFTIRPIRSRSRKEEEGHSVLSPPSTACRTLQECSHRLVCTSNLQLEKVCTVAVAVLCGALRGHAVGVGKLLLASKDVLHLLLLHRGLFEVALFEVVLVWTGPAFEAIHPQRVSGSRLSAGNRQRIAAIGAERQRHVEWISRKLEYIREKRN